MFVLSTLSYSRTAEGLESKEGERGDDMRKGFNMESNLGSLYVGRPLCQLSYQDTAMLDLKMSRCLLAKMFELTRSVALVA